MRINDVVITAISNLFRVYICWKFIRFFFDERKVEARTEKAVYFIFYIGTLLFFVCLQSHGINLIVNLAGIFLLTLIYKGSLKKKALAAVLIYIMNCGCDTLAYFLFLNSNQDIPETQTFSIVTDLLLLICVIVAAGILGDKAKKELEKGFWVLVMIPVLSILMIVGIGTLGLSKQGIMLCIGVGTLIINMVVLYLYNMLQEAHQNFYEKELLQQQIKVYSNQLETISQTQKKIRHVRHDMVHHIKELYGLAVADKKEELLAYLKEMEEAVVNPKEHVCTGNYKIDGILNYMLEKAENELKKVEVKVKIPEWLHMDTFDLVIIIGNLLDNAIEAARQTDDKYLSFKMTLEKGVLFIDVANSYCGVIKIRESKILTSKRDPGDHGFGLESVQEIVRKHDGVTDVTYGRDTFKARVMIYMKSVR